MDSSLTELCQYFNSASGRGERLVLATTIRTAGSTYRKAGARVLISHTGETSGLLSGGCLEADLLARAHRVIDREQGERVVWDTRGSEDIVWGLGLGCEGVTEVWLQPVTAQNAHAPLPYLRQCLDEERDGGVVVTVIGGDARPGELGRHGYAGVIAHDPLEALLGTVGAGRASIERVRYLDRTLEVFVAPVELPPALLLCGGGPDAVPVAELAASLGWRVTIIDHRPAFAVAAHFPKGARVILARAHELRDRVRTAKFSAAVIMSHHLPSDVEYLRQLAREPPRYVGLLGPASRRARLLDAVGPALDAMTSRIYGPVGLDIGANTPASIAVSIIAQIHAVLSGHAPDQS